MYEYCHTSICSTYNLSNILSVLAMKDLVWVMCFQSPLSSESDIHKLLIVIFVLYNQSVCTEFVWFFLANFISYFVNTCKIWIVKYQK